MEPWRARGKRRGSQSVQKVSKFTEIICCSSSITQIVNRFYTYLTRFHLTSVMLEYPMVFCFFRFSLLNIQQLRHDRLNTTAVQCRFFDHCSVYMIMSEIIHQEPWRQITEADMPWHEKSEILSSHFCMSLKMCVINTLCFSIPEPWLNIRYKEKYQNLPT